MGLPLKVTWGATETTGAAVIHVACRECWSYDYRNDKLQWFLKYKVPTAIIIEGTKPDKITTYATGTKLTTE